MCEDPLDLKTLLGRCYFQSNSPYLLQIESHLTKFYGPVGEQADSDSIVDGNYMVHWMPPRPPDKDME